MPVENDTDDVDEGLVVLSVLRPNESSASSLAQIAARRADQMIIPLAASVATPFRTSIRI